MWIFLSLYLTCVVSTKHRKWTGLGTLFDHFVEEFAMVGLEPPNPVEDRDLPEQIIKNFVIDDAVVKPMTIASASTKLLSIALDIKDVLLLGSPEAMERLVAGPDSSAELRPTQISCIKPSPDDLVDRYFLTLKGATGPSIKIGLAIPTVPKPVMTYFGQGFRSFMCNKKNPGNLSHNPGARNMILLVHKSPAQGGKWPQSFPAEVIAAAGISSGVMVGSTHYAAYPILYIISSMYAPEEDIANKIHAKPVLSSLDKYFDENHDKPSPHIPAVPIRVDPNIRVGFITRIPKQTAMITSVDSAQIHVAAIGPTIIVHNVNFGTNLEPTIFRGISLGLPQAIVVKNRKLKEPYKIITTGKASDLQNAVVKVLANGINILVDRIAFIHQSYVKLEKQELSTPIASFLQNKKAPNVIITAAMLPNVFAHFKLPTPIVVEYESDNHLITAIEAAMAFLDIPKVLSQVMLVSASNPSPLLRNRVAFVREEDFGNFIKTVREITSNDRGFQWSQHLQEAKAAKIKVPREEELEEKLPVTVPGHFSRVDETKVRTNEFDKPWFWIGATKNFIYSAIFEAAANRRQDPSIKKVGQYCFAPKG